MPSPTSSRCSRRHEDGGTVGGIVDSRVSQQHFVELNVDIPVPGVFKVYPEDRVRQLVALMVEVFTVFQQDSVQQHLVEETLLLVFIQCLVPGQGSTALLGADSPAGLQSFVPRQGSEALHGAGRQDFLPEHSASASSCGDDPSSGWQRHVLADGRLYWWNVHTGQTTAMMRGSSLLVSILRGGAGGAVWPYGNACTFAHHESEFH